MALKKGLCHNYGECGLADSREIQEKDSTEFVCEECGKALQEVGGEKKGGKKANKRGLLLMLAALLLIGIIVAVCILLFHKSEPPTLALNKSNCELVVGENDTLSALISPTDNEFEVKWLSDNENVVMASTSGIVKAVGEGEANVTAVIKTKKEEIQAVCHYIVLPLPVDTDTVAMVDFTKLSFVREKIEATVGDTVQLSLLKEPATGNEDIEWSSSDESIATVDAAGLVVACGAGQAEVVAKSSRTELNASMPITVKKSPAAKKGSTGGSSNGKKDLGYATYEGPLSNGQPHGNGTMYFKTSHVIPGTVNVTAEAGEKVIGAFRDGKINVGTLYRKNGNQVVVRAGQSF